MKQGFYRSTWNPTWTPPGCWNWCFRPFCYPQPRPGPYFTARYTGVMEIERFAQSHNCKAQVGIKLTTLGWELKTTTTIPRLEAASPCWWYPTYCMAGLADKWSSMWPTLIRWLIKGSSSSRSGAEKEDYMWDNPHPGIVKIQKWMKIVSKNHPYLNPQWFWQSLRRWNPELAHKCSDIWVKVWLCAHMQNAPNSKRLGQLNSMHILANMHLQAIYT